MITNADAGTADEETLEPALAVLRERASVEVAATSNPGELDGVLHRAGSRRIVVAGGDGSLHAVVAALHRRNELAGRTLGLLPLGTGNDFARGTGIPLDIEEAARLVLDGEPRPVDLIVDEIGEVVVNNVHVGAGAQASRHGPQVEDAARRHRRRQGQPRQARLPDRRPARRRQPAESSGCASRSTARSSTTSTGRC